MPFLKSRLLERNIKTLIGSVVLFSFEDTSNAEIQKINYRVQNLIS
jgi:hypothetical protein